ncbi:hypothetical protein X777_02885 [Ooceraea biroi]|uniref:Uncharacterized protein n=1 Tax=Ooceraea biroi TaxID=2015173 RepID=A0A026WJP5_OOCBI|nr:hypothetical protein X777_02885 [Ooceraea biroi]
MPRDIRLSVREGKRTVYKFQFLCSQATKLEESLSACLLCTSVILDTSNTAL